MNPEDLEALAAFVRGLNKLVEETGVCIHYYGGQFAVQRMRTDFDGIAVSLDFETERYVVEAMRT